MSPVDFVVTLFMLILLQAVLGFDNLLYISLESKRAPKEKQAFVRKMGIGIAIGLRIVLLFLVVNLVSKFQKPLFSIPLGSEVAPKATHGAHPPETVHSLVDGTFNFHALIVLVGGMFILYTAVKEIFHMLGQHDLSQGNTKPRSAKMTIFWIVLMNLVFSFDSILSAMALAKDENGDPNVLVMVIAVVISGILMIWLSDRVASFLEKNRMFEVLGLFILLIVGVMLLTEGAHLAHLHLGGNPIMPMTKTTFYFVIGILLLTDLVQGRYQKKILREQARAAGA